jgi:hypothetical protein
MTLFDFKPHFFDHLKTALELGRSFIRTEYQKKFGCLSLLWRGIGEFVARNPRYRYLFGPVSISQASLSHDFQESDGGVPEPLFNGFPNGSLRKTAPALQSAQVSATSRTFWVAGKGLHRGYFSAS